MVPKISVINLCRARLYMNSFYQRFNKPSTYSPFPLWECFYCYGLCFCFHWLLLKWTKPIHWMGKRLSIKYNKALRPRLHNVITGSGCGNPVVTVYFPAVEKRLLLRFLKITSQHGENMLSHDKPDTTNPPVQMSLSPCWEPPHRANVPSPGSWCSTSLFLKTESLWSPGDVRKEMGQTKSCKSELITHLDVVWRFLGLHIGTFNATSWLTSVWFWLNLYFIYIFKI